MMQEPQDFFGEFETRSHAKAIRWREETRRAGGAANVTFRTDADTTIWWVVRVTKLATDRRPPPYW